MTTPALKRLVEALTDIRDHGCRHDTNPTLDHEWTTMEWYSYTNSMDQRVRETAQAALAALPPDALADDVVVPRKILEGMMKCKTCGGEGQWMRQTGPEEGEAEQCHWCNATGESDNAEELRALLASADAEGGKL